MSFKSKDSLNSTNQTANGDNNIQVMGNNNTVNSNAVAKTQQHDKNNPSVRISGIKISGTEILTESGKGSSVKYGKNVSSTTPGTKFDTGESGEAIFQEGGIMEQTNEKIKISTKPKI